ncbi:SH3 domain-containing protein [Glutamicibacter sp. JC586]|uniref:SH3 domain-containing protein n=1 Tax=Glutamicibacter sp. JC586 TaxID=2590552 RepID=UPI0013581B36|nr:SH3 domain-containing protein [Glutamicibacter sp. JC586]
MIKPRRVVATLISAVAIGALSIITATPSTATNAAAAVEVALPAASTNITEVRTTANLNLRSSAGTSGRILKTIPTGSSVPVSDVASNGWYKVTYKGMNGWISNKYVTVTAKTSESTSKNTDASSVKSVNLWLAATSKVNIRKSPNTSSAVAGSLPKHAAVKATSRAANGWYKITYKKTTGWVSNQYVLTCTKGCQVDTGAYSTNRAGLTDRYYTKVAGADLYSAAGKRLRIGDIPKNSVVYRDLKWEKAGGQVAGWYFVRTQGMDGWMKASQLGRKSTATTSNSRGYTRASVMKQKNGKIPASMLVAISRDKEKTLIAAPAAKDLSRLNTAFKKKFGKNLDIDLAYRTLETQQYYYKELGPYIAAKPGTSNHGWGLAIDVPESYDYSFRGKYYKWLKANSKKYNWIHRSNLEEFRANGTRNPYAEAWHFEYNGK